MCWSRGRILTLRGNAGKKAEGASDKTQMIASSWQYRIGICSGEQWGTEVNFQREKNPVTELKQMFMKSRCTLIR